MEAETSEEGEAWTKARLMSGFLSSDMEKVAERVRLGHP